MICTVDHLASSAGLSMLRGGGSAADAAVAAGAVLAVTAQHMCGLGGDLFALVHDGAGPPVALNASGRSGSGADALQLRLEGHRSMPFRRDIRSVPVPGCVDGWSALHERFGRLPLRDVLEPAIVYAHAGFPASPLLAGLVPLLDGVTHAEELVRPVPLRSGEVLTRPSVGALLEELATEGRSGFYEGRFAERLIEVGAGEYDAEDLRQPHADWVEPIGLDVWGSRVWTVPPNSQGYLILASAWMAERLPLPDDPRDPLWAHLLIEASKQAGCDRNEVLHEHAVATELLDPARLEPRLEAIGSSGPSPLPVPSGHGDTAYLCVVDADRMAVSLIQSNAADFGAHLVLPEVKVFLHNRGIGFNLVPGHPAEYGPRRRPPHTLSPALVTDPAGALRAVLGTMGGDAQPQIVLQLLTRLLRHGQTTGEAVTAPRFSLVPGGFDTWKRPRGITAAVEDHARGCWSQGLRSRGHDVGIHPAGSGFGHAHCIAVTPAGLAGAADPRAQIGSTAGY
ncbi:MAG: gamma-glutamyltranspeptidase [Actinobacteria bacterium]|nr:MAG: gamma-glutamyltranspeptidase [Actinomycetota bacterium]RIK07348.1 MAG: gamma-glutamyltranspeptidase [Acidobacteriota bacterium]